MGDENNPEKNQFEELIQGLIDNEYGSCNDFLLPSTVMGLRANMAILKATGDLKVAGIGNKSDFQKNTLIRGDKVNWIDQDSIDPFEDIYLKKVWRFIQHLNQTCFTSINNYESHYANYEKGKFYKKHVDQFKNENARQFSIILYLNENWKAEDEGMLSLYPANGVQQRISPVGGRMVFFKSEEMEHEVHPSSTKERKSIAGWLKN